MRGGYGADRIDGGDGADFFWVEYDEGASDTLSGGAGADTFYFSASYWQGNPQASFPGPRRSHHRLLGRARRCHQPEFVQPELGFRVWYGAIANPNFSLTAGQSLAGAAGAEVIGGFSWSSQGVNYLIVDVDRDLTLTSTDFVLAFEGDAQLSRAAFAPGVFRAEAGTDSADQWSGSQEPEIFYGGAGADQIRGLGSYDMLFGGAGDDLVDGGDGGDTLSGDNGSDTLVGGAGDDTLYAGPMYNQGVEAATTRNVLQGGEGNDVLYHAAGRDELDGGVGDDTIQGGAGDTVLGGDGADRISLDSYSGGATVNGGAGNDLIFAWESGHQLTGGAGADTFTILGVSSGTGWTEFGYITLTDFNLAEGDKLDWGYGPFNQFGVLRGAVDANFSLTLGKTFSAQDYGGEFNQIWHWASGGDTFVIVDSDANGVLSSSDLVLKFAGAFTLTKAALLDWSADDLLVVDGTNAPDTFVGGVGNDRYFAVGGDDVLRGGDGADSLYGSLGADQIWGEDGADQLAGGDGSDFIDGGAGTDAITGGAGLDTLWGGEGRDVIEGGADFDQINGNQGDDTARGGAGDDWVVGGKDQDLLYGDAGFDVVYGNLGDDTCFGGEGADWVRGGQGDDVISGGSGDDWLAGDRGSDTVSGGAGADRFYFFAGAGIDRVNDFYSAGGDRVLLDAGQTYTLSYASEGAVVDLGNGDQLILLGVTQATIGDWLV
jgi:Ca2+-binding RTX toxin-like protein